jgi:hypothetical protein
MPTNLTDQQAATFGRAVAEWLDDLVEQAREDGEDLDDALSEDAQELWDQLKDVRRTGRPGSAVRARAATYPLGRNPHGSALVRCKNVLCGQMNRVPDGKTAKCGKCGTDL